MKNLKELKNLRVGQVIDVRIEKLTLGKDEKVYVTVANKMFSNKPTFIIKEK